MLEDRKNGTFLSGFRLFRVASQNWVFPQSKLEREKKDVILGVFIAFKYGNGLNLRFKTS